MYLLIITGIFFIMGINTTNGAGAYTTVGLDKYNSAIDSQFKLGFLKGGGFLTEYLGQGKSILAMDNNVLFRRAPNGQPYFYSPNMQGFFSHYAVCDYMANTNSGLHNCSMSLLTGDFKSMFKGFFTKVKQGDIAYYNYQYDQGGVNCGYHHYYITVCRSSEEIGSTLCFNYQNCYNGCSLNQCSNYCSNGLCGGGLINSENLHDLDRGLVANSRIGYAPGQAGYDGSSNIEGGNETFVNIGVTGDVVVASCPKSQALSWYQCNGYKEGLCYSNYTNNTDLYWSGANQESFATTGIDVENVWFDTAQYRRYGQTGSAMSYEDFVKYWRKTYDVYSKNPDMNNPFIGVPLSIYGISSAWGYYGLPYSTESIIEFCDLLLYRNLSTDYTGIAQNEVCGMSAIDLVSCRTAINNRTGSIGVVGSSWQGITNRDGYGLNSGSNTTIGDGLTFENNYFNVLKNSFRFSDRTGTGIIPYYIILALMGLILFRFMSR